MGHGSPRLSEQTMQRFCSGDSLKLPAEDMKVQHKSRPFRDGYAAIVLRCATLFAYPIIDKKPTSDTQQALYVTHRILQL